MQRIILIRGPLGVGKATVSRTLAEKLGATYFSGSVRNSVEKDDYNTVHP